MRVLIDYRPALRQRTGVGEYVHQLAVALVPFLDRRRDLTLFSSSWKDRLLPDAVNGAGTLDVRLPVRALNFAWHRLEWPPVELFAGNVDVAHSLHPLMIPARRAAQVVTIHDLYFLDRPDSVAAEIRRDYPTLTGVHARRADAVIVVSGYTARQVQARLEVAADRISICPAGAPSWPPRRSQNPSGPILFVGTIEPRKNVATLITAYRSLRETRADVPPLVLAGGIRPESRGTLDELRHSSLSGKARYLGYVSDDQRQQLYRDASVLVMPSLDEGFGLPALEAMTVGVPVIASNRGALPELVGNAGLLVEPDDPEGIAAAVGRVLSDPVFAAECVERGWARAQQFTWRATAARVLEAYSAAMTRRAARS